MKTFKNLDKFAEQMQKVAENYEKHKNYALKFIGIELQKSAKDKIGHLQPSAGHFEAWKELAESTKKEKEQLGYVYNSDYNPLFRTGNLRNSIKYVVNKVTSTVYVGSSSEIMIYQEFGTQFIPPRSVLGLTLFKAKPFIMGTLEKMMVNLISGNRMTFKKGLNE